MEQYGGPRTPGLGFALGFERTLLAMQAAGAQARALERAQVYVAAVDDSCREAVFALTAALRDDGIAADCDHQARSLKSQFKQADRAGVRLIVLAGPDELAEGQATLRDMGTKQESRVPLGDVTRTVADILRNG